MVDKTRANTSPSKTTVDQQRTPPCLICTSATVLYGLQRYTVPNGEVASRIYRCKACDFNFRRFDRPLAEVVEHFQVAPYSSADGETRWLRRRAGFYRYLLTLLTEPAKGKALLDVGCAFGHFLDCAAELGYEPFGTEISEAMAELTRRRCGYPVSTRSLNDLQLPKDRFDAVTFVDSFYYFEDPVSTLRQAHNLLKPEGELLMRVTNRNPFARLHRVKAGLRFSRRQVPDMPFWTTDDAISCHSRRSLSILMQRSGFRIIKLTGLEQGKKIDSFALRNFYRLTRVLCRLTGERVCYTPGLVCLAEPV